MSGHDRIVSVLSQHGSEWWDDGDCALHADALVEHADLADADSIAHTLWTMGAAKPARDKPIHNGCWYAGEDGNDADYSNACDVCVAWLTGLGHKVIAALTPTETNRTPS